jgi:hypothetical protein
MPEVAELGELILNPAARVLWRSPDTVQLELGATAILLAGVDHDTMSRLLGREPTRRRRPARAGAESEFAGALPELHAAGFLLPETGGRGWARPVPRLTAELGAIRARCGDRAERVLSHRQDAVVTVQGASRLAAVVAAVLGAAGVGRVTVEGAGDVRLHHAAPGGTLPTDEGDRYAVAAGLAVRRGAPECDTSPLPFGTRPDLTVMVLDGPLDDDDRNALHARDSSHLIAHAGASTGVVGPLVVPGVTSCLHCADLHRSDRDPAWPALAVQLGLPRGRPSGSDAAVVSLIAGMSAVQALSFLDAAVLPEPDLPVVADGTLEVQLPDWRIRRRSWPPHPECDCGASGRRARDLTRVAAE